MCLLHTHTAQFTPYIECPVRFQTSALVKSWISIGKQGRTSICSALWSHKHSLLCTFYYSYSKSWGFCYQYQMSHKLHICIVRGRTSNFSVKWMGDEIILFRHFFDIPRVSEIRMQCWPWMFASRNTVLYPLVSCAFTPSIKQGPKNDARFYRTIAYNAGNLAL